jgi:hypothetical protein
METSSLAKTIGVNNKEITAGSFISSMATLLRRPQITIRLVIKTIEDLKSDGKYEPGDVSDTPPLKALAEAADKYSLDDDVEFIIPQALIEAKGKYFRATLKIGGFQESTSDMKEISLIPGVLSAQSVEALLSDFIERSSVSRHQNLTFVKRRLGDHEEIPPVTITQRGL